MYFHQLTGILRMWLFTIALFLVILVANVRGQCPTTCASVLETNTNKYCPDDSVYRCIDLPGCNRVREYCFCIGNRKFDTDVEMCVGINECDIEELTGICTNDRPSGPGCCGEKDACTLSNISCSTVSQPVCGEAICQDLPNGYECYCIGNLVLTETPEGLTCEKPVCRDCESLGIDNICYPNACCDNNACTGNGKCEITNPPKYNCICDRGHSGERCENEICKSEIDTFFGFEVEWVEGNPNDTSYINCETINSTFIGIATRKCARNSVWNRPDYTQCIRGKFSILKQNSLRNVDIIELQNSINDVTTAGILDNMLFSGELILVINALENLITQYVDIQEGSRTLSEDEYVATIETPDIAVRAGSHVLSGVNRKTWDLIGNITALVSLVDSFEKFSLALYNSNNTVSSGNLDLTYKRVDTSSRVELSSGSETGNETRINVVIREDLVKLLNRSCNETFFSSIRFRTIRELLPVVVLHDSHADTESNTTLISDVYSLNTKQCMNMIFALPEGSIKIDFMFQKQPKNSDTRYICAFWNLTTNAWSTQGVKTITQQQQEDDFVKVTCTPIHLTSFAILLSSYTPTETDNTIQTVLSVITCSLSVVSLVVSLLCYLILYLRTRKSAKNPFKPDSIFIIHINLCMALLLATFTFLISPFATWHRIPCTIIAGLQHYLWLSAFSWSLCEGIAIVWKIRFWNRTQVIWPVLTPLGWGLPIPIVVITIPVTYSYYVDLDIGCWVNSLNNLKLISFILPIIMTIPTNFLFYCYTLVKNFRLKERFDSKKQVRSTIIGSLILLPLLSIPWVIGVFYVNKDTAIFGYIFIILIGCQGVFFFIAHVARNTRIQEYVFKWKSLYNEHAQTSNKFMKL